MSLKDKIIIVVGGSGLLGKEIINEIIQSKGIPINLDLKIDEMCFSLKTDVTSKKSITKSFKIVLEKYKRIDGVVNTSYAKTKDWSNNYENTDVLSFNKNLEFQLSSVFFISKLALMFMKEQNFGSIVNLASIYGVIGFDRHLYENTKLTLPVAYSAIKGGLINMNRYLASYFGKYNIRTNCISPGGIFANQETKFINKYKKKVPLGRMGYPKDVSPLVVFLLSDKSSYITGQNIIVDGGLTII